MAEKRSTNFQTFPDPAIGADCKCHFHFFLKFGDLITLGHPR